MATYSSSSELEVALNKAITKGVEATIKEAENMLKQFIGSEYYDAYTPNMYVRTGQFRNSPDSRMETMNMGIVEINYSKMNYRNDSPVYVVNLAAGGYHGNTSIHVPNYFWETFLSWCESNIERLLERNIKANL